MGLCVLSPSLAQSLATRALNLLNLLKHSRYSCTQPTQPTQALNLLKHSRYSSTLATHALNTRYKLAHSLHIRSVTVTTLDHPLDHSLDHSLDHPLTVGTGIVLSFNLVSAILFVMLQYSEDITEVDGPFKVATVSQRHVC